jgi:hypothetical protein
VTHGALRVGGEPARDDPRLLGVELLARLEEVAVEARRRLQALDDARVEAHRQVLFRQARGEPEGGEERQHRCQHQCQGDLELEARRQVAPHAHRMAPSLTENGRERKT